MSGAFNHILSHQLTQKQPTVLTLGRLYLIPINHSGK